MGLVTRWKKKQESKKRCCDATRPKSVVVMQRNHTVRQFYQGEGATIWGGVAL